MQATKHDLSGEWARLDYSALYETAEMAFVHARDDISRNMDRMYRRGPELSTSDMVSAARSIERAARQLSIAIETFHTLAELKTRDEVVIINHPKDEESINE